MKRKILNFVMLCLMIPVVCLGFMGCSAGTTPKTDDGSMPTNISWYAVTKDNFQDMYQENHMEFNKHYTKVHVKGNWISSTGLKEYDETFDITTSNNTYVIYLEEEDESTMLTVCFKYNMTAMNSYSSTAQQTLYYFSDNYDYIKLHIVFDVQNGASSDMSFGQGSYLREYSANMGYANYKLNFTYSE